MACKTIIYLALVSYCLAAPIDDPIRVDLPVYNKPHVGYNEPEVQDSAIAYLPENYPGGEPLDLSAGGNYLAHKHQMASNIFGNTDSQVNYFGGPFSAPVTKIENAIQETEGLGSRALSFKENIQHVVAGILQPKPIVDTIHESEKYGNTGDKFYSAGKAIVGGASGVSNLVNTVLEVPGSILKKITRAATEKLNNLGGKLIGL